MRVRVHKRHKNHGNSFVFLVPFCGLEVELRHELNLARSAGSRAENLTKRTGRQHEVRIRHEERRRVRHVLRFNTDLQVLRLAESELLAKRHIEIEERRTSEEVSAHVACFARRRYEELRPLLGSEENVLPVLERWIIRPSANAYESAVFSG